MLPGEEQVVDDFRWRMNDAARCCLNGHADWLLRRQGLGTRAASERLRGMERSDKHEWLFQQGLNFDALPTWQKRGFGVYWSTREIAGVNPLNGEVSQTQRRVLHLDQDLPWKEDYAAGIRRLLAGASFTRVGTGDQTRPDSMTAPPPSPAASDNLAPAGGRSPVKPCAIAPAIRTEILARLAAIEAVHEVRILYACESGSRGWGFTSPDSDYDVRFFNVHPLPCYLRVCAQRDVINVTSPHEQRTLLEGFAGD